MPIPGRRPPPPPRRVPPPLPATRNSATKAAIPESDESPEEPEPVLTGLQARIAALKLDQVGRTKPIKPPPTPPRRESLADTLPVYTESESPPPRPSLPPRRATQDAPSPPPRQPAARPPIPPRRDTQPDALLVHTEPRETTGPAPDISHLLSRRPPPPPVRGGVPAALSPSPPTSPTPPRRRLPPMPTKRNTPSPPPLPLSSKPQLPAQPLGPVQSLSCMRCYDFSAVDEHASRFPRHTVSSLQSLSYDLTEPFDTETEKARALFTWLHHNITYDVDAFLSGNIQPSTPESTLSSGLAVCDGYAGLFKYLAECVGMQVHKITGHGKGVGYKALEPGEPLPPMQMNHAWNCILTDGVWRLVDPCWGAGALNITMYVKRFDASWFTSTPAEFGRRHFPEDSSYQLIADEDGGPISWEQYMDEPEPGPIIFGQFYEAKLDPATIQPASKFIKGGQYVHFSVFKLCEHMSTADEDNFVYFVMMENSRTPLYLNDEGGWSADVFIPAGAEVALYFVTTVNGQDAKGLGAHGFNAVNGRSAMQFGALLKWSPA